MLMCVVSASRPGGSDAFAEMARPTDDEERQHRLYRSVGYRDAGSIPESRLHTFVMLNT